MPTTGQKDAQGFQSRARLSARLKLGINYGWWPHVPKISVARATECKTETSVRSPALRRIEFQSRARLSARLKRFDAAFQLEPRLPFQISRARLSARLKRSRSGRMISAKREFQSRARLSARLKPMVNRAPSIRFVFQSRARLSARLKPGEISPRDQSDFSRARD